MISGKYILITGGAGFIGSHLAAQLNTKNRVTVLDTFETGSRSNVSFLPSKHIIEGSVTNASLVTDLVEDADFVLHLAAMMGVKRTLENPLAVLQINIDGTRTVLEAAANASVERVLVASTSEVYGDAPQPPYSEDDEKAPKTNYAVAKFADERFTRAYGQQHDLDYTILRYFNVYGPKQDSSAYGYVVPIFVRKALTDSVLEIHGDGEQTRDFTYIDDAVDGSLRALQPAGQNEVFNIGAGTEIQISQLAETVREEVGTGSIEHIDHPRPYTVQRRCADISKAQNQLGYHPQHSLRQGIRQLRAVFETE